MKLYHHPFSSNARKAMMTVHQLGVPVEPVLVDLPHGEQRKPDYLGVNPNGRVPTLVDGDFVLWESHAIMIYLCDKTPASGNALYPTALQPRADVNRWLFWTSNHWAPAIAALNFENMLKKMFGQGEPDPAQVARQERFFAEFAGVLDAHLAPRDWVCGKALTIADFALAAPLMYIGPAKLPVQKFAHVMKWFERVQALEAWQKTNPPPM